MSTGLGMVALVRGDIGQAEGLLRKALAHAEGAVDQGHLVGPILVVLGHLHLMRGNVAEAESMGRRSVQMFEAIGFKMGVALGYKFLAAVRTRATIPRRPRRWRRRR